MWPLEAFNIVSLFLILIDRATLPHAFTTINFEGIGGIPNDMSNEIVWKNGALMNETLQNLQHIGDIFLYPT